MTEKSCPNPKCKKTVLRVIEYHSTRLYAHEIGKKPAQLYGCAISKVERHHAIPKPAHQ